MKGYIESQIQEFTEKLRKVIDKHICVFHAEVELKRYFRQLLINCIMPKNQKFKKDDILLVVVNGKYEKRHIHSFKNDMIVYFANGRSSKTASKGDIAHSRSWKEIEED